MQSEKTRHSRKRVWWCPIGALSSLPLHAAGNYDGEHPEHAAKYAVSSYTSTLTALHRMLTETTAENVTIASPKILLVAQPESTGLPSLPHTQSEVTRVRSLVPAECIINGPGAQELSIDAALAGATGAHVVHIACHGHQDQDNPLNSGFELKDGRLTLGQLMRVNAPNAQLAYLSACESAGMDESRPDEGLNLAGAMIFAGFKSVIATMW